MVKNQEDKRGGDFRPVYLVLFPVFSRQREYNKISRASNGFHLDMYHDGVAFRSPQRMTGFLIQRLKIAKERVLPCYPMVNPDKLLLGVGGIAGQKEKIRIFQRDEPAFRIQLRNVHSHADGKMKTRTRPANYGRACLLVWTKTIPKTVIVFGFASNGGVEGNRTPVREQLGGNFSGCSLLFTFPHPGGNKHPPGFGSFIMHGMRKALHTHGLHSNHTLTRLVDLPGRMGAYLGSQGNRIVVS